jgi:septum formation protein
MDSARFGKPGTVERAIAQLKSMSGRSVIFHTALAVLNTRTGHVQVDAVPTEVRFRTLSDEEIVRYVDKERPSTAPAAPNPKGSASRFSTHSAATTPTPSSACR